MLYLPWVLAEWSSSEGGKWRPSACLVAVGAVLRGEALARTREVWVLSSPNANGSEVVQVVCLSCCVLVHHGERLGWGAPALDLILLAGQACGQKCVRESSGWSLCC